MSELLSFAVVAEGPTDAIIIEAAIRAILPGRSFTLTMLQPEGSIAFGQFGGGWRGVYGWCHQSARRGGGKLSGDGLLFERFDGLILHVDADVAAATYASANIEPTAGDGSLPCAGQCPPATELCDAMRAVLLSWGSESECPPRVVLCVPSKSTEAWVVSALLPDDAPVRDNVVAFECFGDPASRLPLQPKSLRFAKSQRDYRDRAVTIEAAWPRISVPGCMSQAARFSDELTTALATAAGS